MSDKRKKAPRRNPKFRIELAAFPLGCSLVETEIVPSPTLLEHVLFTCIDQWGAARVVKTLKTILETQKR